MPITKRSTKIVLGLAVFLVVASPFLLRVKPTSLGGYPPSYYFDEDGLVELCRAIARNDEGAVERLAKGGVDVNVKGNDGMTVLYWAMAFGNRRAFSFLLERGADPDTQVWEKSLLSHAAGLEDSEFIDALLTHKAKVDSVDQRDDCTPLYSAVMSDSLNNVRRLADAGANLDFQDRTGSTPMRCAALLNRYDIVCTLLEKGADPTVKDNWGFTIAREIKTSFLSMDRSSPLFEWLLKAVALLEERGVKLDAEAR